MNPYLVCIYIFVRTYTHTELQNIVMCQTKLFSSPHRRKTQQTKTEDTKNAKLSQSRLGFTFRNLNPPRFVFPACSEQVFARRGAVAHR